MILSEVWINILFATEFIFLSWAFKNDIKISFFSYFAVPNFALTCHWKIDFTPNCSQLNFKKRYLNCSEFDAFKFLNVQNSIVTNKQYYKVDVTSTLGWVCLDRGAAVSVFSSRWNRAIQPALTLLIVLLFATKARKIKNPERNVYPSKRTIKVDSFICLLTYCEQIFIHIYRGNKNN